MQWSELIHCKYRQQAQCNSLHQYKEKSTYVTELTVGGSRLPGKGKNEATVLLQERERELADEIWPFLRRILFVKITKCICEHGNMCLSKWQNIFDRIPGRRTRQQICCKRELADETWPYSEKNWPLREFGFVRHQLGVDLAENKMTVFQSFDIDTKIFIFKKKNRFYIWDHFEFWLKLFQLTMFDAGESLCLMGFTSCCSHFTGCSKNCTVIDGNSSQPHLSPIFHQSCFFNLCIRILHFSMHCKHQDCFCICVCICICICICKWDCIYICVYIYICVCICFCICIYILLEKTAPLWVEVAHPDLGVQPGTWSHFQPGQSVFATQ